MIVAPSAPEEILRELVSFNSVSSRSNRDIIAYLAGRARTLGMGLRHFPFNDDQGLEKINLLAVAPHATPISETLELLLVGHTDTVPFIDPGLTALREDDGRLYGRGSCDTKGFIAAALSAAAQFDLTRLRRPLGLLFTADEEVGCIGAGTLAEAKAFSARYSIVGEPTSLRPVRGGKGYCVAAIEITGRESHSAHPHLGLSAILAAARLIARIEEIAQELQSRRDAAFDPPFTTINIGTIEGGTARNVVPGKCRFSVEWRPLPGQAAEQVLELIKSSAAQLSKQSHGVNIQAHLIRADGGIKTNVESPLVRALEQASGKPAGTVSFATEAPHIARLGAETVVFGPGDIRTAHTEQEFVPAYELHRCAAILAQMIAQFCG